MRTRFLNLTVMVAVVALSGCEAMDAAFFPNKSAPASAPAEPPAPTPAVQTATIDRDLRPGIKPQPRPQHVDPKTLVGKNQGDVREMLGAPVDIQNAAPATIWRYTAAGCALDVFFYMDLGTNTLRALTYDVQPTNSTENEETAAQCIGMIQSTNRLSSR